MAATKDWNLLNPHEKDYIIRAAQLRKLGFKTYAHFQKSKLWESIKARLLQLPENHFCARCDREAKDFHHTHYKTMDKSVGIVPLCGGCHRICHWFAKVNKLSLLDATNQALKTSNRREAEPFKNYHENSIQKAS